MSGIDLPPGVILFEDPPIHDLHRRVLSRVFTPRRMEAIEPLTRDFCVRALDPLVGSGRFDFIENIGAMVPMRTIGYLLGIPEDNQEAIRDRGGRQITLSPRARSGPSTKDFFEQSHRDVRRVHRLASRPSLRRPDDSAAERRDRGGRRRPGG